MTDEETGTARLSEDIEALRSAGSLADQRAPWRLSAGVLVLLGIAIAVASWFVMDRMQPRAERVYGFAVQGDGLSEADAWIKPAFARALSAHVAASENIRLVGARDGLPELAPDESAMSIRRRTGADWSLAVEIFRVDEQTVSARLQLTDLVGATLTPAREVVGTPEAIGDLAGRGASELFQLLGAPFPDAARTERVDAELPRGAVAGRAYTDALNAIERGDGEDALSLLEIVDAETPDHPLAISARSQAWALMGYMQRSAVDADRAYELRAGLTRERELVLEALKLEAAGQWGEASEVWRALVRFFPDDVFYGLELADALMRADEFDNALAAISELRALPEPMKSDPRIGVVEARVHNRAGRFAESVAAADRAVARAREIGADALVAEAHLAAVASDAADAEERLETALAIYAESENPRGESAANKELGDLAVSSGRLSEGLESYRRAIALAQAAGNPPQVAAAENAMAIALDLMGRLEEGYERKVRVADYYRERDVMSRYSIMLENIGISLMKLGQYEEAAEEFDAALVVFEEIGDEIGIAWAPYHRGRMEIRRGLIEDGIASLEAAIANSAERPEGSLEVHSRFELMAARTFAGQFAAAAEAARDLSAAYQEIDLPLDAAETEIYASRSLIQLGDLESARRAIDWALRETTASSAGYYLASAHIANVDLELARDSDEAAESCDAMQSVVREQEHLIIRLRGEVRIAVCDLDLGRRASGEVVQRLQELAERSEAADLFEPAYDARRAEAYVLAGSGAFEAARAILERLNARASLLGWAQAPIGCPAATPSRRCEVTALAD